MLCCLRTCCSGREHTTAQNSCNNNEHINKSNWRSFISHLCCVSFPYLHSHPWDSCSANCIAWSAMTSHYITFDPAPDLRGRITKALSYGLFSWREVCRHSSGQHNTVCVQYMYSPKPDTLLNIHSWHNIVQIGREATTVNIRPHHEHCGWFVNEVENCNLIIYSNTVFIRSLGLVNSS